MANDVLKTLLAEAYSEGPEAMRRVAEVILNRAAARGLTPEQVVREAHQFTGLTSPGPKAKRTWTDPKAISAAQAAWELAQQPGDPTGGSDHYHTTKVNPGWASKMPKTGQYGSHLFYASRPIPPGDVPEVATLTDTVPPPIPVPETMTPDMALMRNTPRALPSLPLARPQTAPPDLISRSMAALPSRRSTNLGDDVAMFPIPGGRQSAPLFDAAFDTRVGAMRMLPQPETVSSQGLGVGASRPPPPSPAMPSPQLAGERATDPVLQVALNARYPTRLPEIPQSALGQPPATRTVTSVAMPPFAPPSVPTGPSNLQLARAEQSAARGNGTPMARSLPTAAIPDRLTPEYFPKPVGPPPVVSDPRFSVAHVGNQVNAQGLPIAVPDQANLVASRLDVAAPRAMPQLPRPRPNFGVGGVDVLPVPTSPNPSPMPRLDRPGIFGTPQIFGRDIKLPGFLGGLQDFTKAMNNASGPFNNGADNLLYNRMRGGDFNTPGAATAQAGGYLYAPRQGGGYVNVGRTNPSLSPAQTYDSRNNRNEFQDDAANRVNGRGN